MPCVPILDEQGRKVGLACGVRVRRCACGKVGVRDCDWKVPTRRSGTCDAPICLSCTTVPAPDKDLCARHAGDWKAWLRRKAVEVEPMEAAP